MFIRVGRRRAVPPPDIYEIVHYATCNRCINDIEAQGWRVEFKHKKKKIYEVTFKAREGRESRHFKDKEDEDEDEELKVGKSKRLTVGKKKPKTPEVDFYVV